MASIQIHNFTRDLLPKYSNHSRNNVNVEKRVTITIRENNYERLRKHCKYGDSFNSVIGRLLDQVEDK